jgi:chromosome segregation ATPase
MKLKKIVLLGGVIALGVAFIGTGTVRKLAAYAKQEVQQFADKAGTPEREIERLREEVKSLDKTERQLKDELAQEIVQSDRLSKAVADLRTKVSAERSDVLAFADSIKKADKQVSVGKRMLSIDDAKRQLKLDTQAVAQREMTLKTMESTLGNREEAKSILTQNLNEIQAVKSDLTNTLDALEVEYKALRLQATKNKYTRDDSKLSAVREGIEKLKEKLEVQRVRIGLDTGKGRIDAPVTESVDDILAPLTGKKAGTTQIGD